MGKGKFCCSGGLCAGPWLALFSLGLGNAFPHQRPGVLQKFGKMRLGRTALKGVKPVLHGEKIFLSDLILPTREDSRLSVEIVQTSQNAGQISFSISGTIPEGDVQITIPESGKTVTVSGLALSGASASNYALASTTISGAIEA